MKHYRIICIAIFMVISLFWGFSAWGSKVKQLNLQQLVSQAGIVFEGECIDVKSGDDPESGMIATWYTFRITKGIKGRLGEEYVLKQYGGSNGKVSLSVPSARYNPGEKVVLFLYGKSRLGFSSAVGLHQGKFLIQENQETGSRIVSNGMPTMVLFENMASSVPTVNSKGVQVQGLARLKSDKMELSQFLAEVKRLVEQEKEVEKQKK